LLVNYLQIIDFALGLLLSILTLIFLIRLILTWYPKINIHKGFWLIISIPSSPILNLTKKVVPPIGGVDVTPVIWIGLISFAREILVGQQGLIKLALHNYN